jgi:hypothetical protein
VAQRPGETNRQEGVVAQSHQIVANRGEDLAQDFGGGGQFVRRQRALIGGNAVDAGHGLCDLGLGGGHRIAGDEVQIADGGAAQGDGGDTGAAAALGGEEGGDVGGAGRQAGRGHRTRRAPRWAADRAEPGPAAATGSRTGYPGALPGIRLGGGDGGIPGGLPGAQACA